MTERAHDAAAVLAVALLIFGAPACARREPSVRPPSIVLVVLDTTRADAVSSYGRVRDTTPTVDALAERGLRYTRAYAPAPWTLPSHASLFTGLLPSRHGVTWRHTRAADSLVTLAERLRGRGYETVGVSENPWVSEAFNLAQGFERFSLVKGFTLTADAPLPDAGASEVAAAVGSWLAERRDARPFFLFVNLLDAHMPYLVRATNPFLPAGAGVEEARAVPQDAAGYFCRAEPESRALRILHGLYLGGVAAADAKLGEVLASLQRAGLDRDLVTIVTADHGEHFGERRLVGHQFSVHDALVRVPLVVHGLAEVGPAVIDTPVSLVDIVPTVLGLARMPVPPDLTGRSLPVSPAPRADERAIVAEHDDSEAEHVQDEAEIARLIRDANRVTRRQCGPDDRVFGAMRAVVRHPWKLVWYAAYPSELYDLAADPAELRDLAGTRTDVVGALRVALAGAIGSSSESASSLEPAVGAGTPAPLASDVRERLRALGYLGDGDEARHPRRTPAMSPPSP